MRNKVLYTFLNFSQTFALVIFYCCDENPLTKLTKNGKNVELKVFSVGNHKHDGCEHGSRENDIGTVTMSLHTDKRAGGR